MKKIFTLFGVFLVSLTLALTAADAERQRQERAAADWASLAPQQQAERLLHVLLSFVAPERLAEARAYLGLASDEDLASLRKMVAVDKVDG